MEKVKINRINELSRLAKTRDLTKDETDERGILRAEYIKAFRDNLKQTLDSTVIQNPDGSTVKLKNKK